MHEVLVNRFGGLSLPKKSVARLIDRPDMTLEFTVDVKQQHNCYNNKSLPHHWPRTSLPLLQKVRKLFSFVKKRENMEEYTCLNMQKKALRYCKAK